MKNNQTGVFIPFPNDSFIARALDRKGRIFDMDARGLYLTWTHSRIFMNYSGEQAGDSHTTMELPCDPDFLRQMAEKLNDMADSIE
ncbi:MULTISPECIES: hypothetical protein [Pectobacterium]|uniref:hypothetical protein n=1 Tax=Pectobacterium TaxID=122277 RepID=UPI000F8F6F29|nr:MULTISPECIES: hypothetical protein [Pectobacterium]AZS59288.1 hypothetical protein C5E18_24540 [Pectobacterium parmentieri]QHP82857.1 hypothetical protein EO763_23500 [Pectobacterium odoriferum]